eukprot:6479616-Amphidinium_carterae.2
MLAMPGWHGEYAKSLWHVRNAILTTTECCNPRLQKPENTIKTTGSHRVTEPSVRVLKRCNEPMLRVLASKQAAETSCCCEQEEAAAHDRMQPADR